MNKVFMVGRATRDFEMRYTPSGTAVGDLSLATNRKYKTDDGMKEETTFVDCVLWGRQAEVAAEYVKKGKELVVEGRLQQDTWEDKETGTKRSKLRVVVENFQFVGSAGGSSKSSEEQKVKNEPSVNSEEAVPF